MSGVRRVVQVVNPQGMHARPSALVVRIANQFRSVISLEREGTKVDAKSMMDVMMLACPKGSQITLSACGEDAEAAIDALAELFRTGFHEVY